MNTEYENQKELSKKDVIVNEALSEVLYFLNVLESIEHEQDINFEPMLKDTAKVELELPKKFLQLLELIGYLTQKKDLKKFIEYTLVCAAGTEIDTMNVDLLKESYKFLKAYEIRLDGKKIKQNE